MVSLLNTLFPTISYLVVRANGLLALLAIMGEKFLVTGYTVRMFFLQNVATGDQLLVAVLTGKMILVVVLIHGLCILCRKYQLKIEK